MLKLTLKSLIKFTLKSMIKLILKSMIKFILKFMIKLIGSFYVNESQGMTSGFDITWLSYSSTKKMKSLASFVTELLMSQEELVFKNKPSFVLFIKYLPFSQKYLNLQIKIY